MYALLTQTPFECHCPDPDTCTATIIDIEGAEFPVHVDPRVVVHVVVNESTLNNEDEEPGVIDGHGVVSADHVRDVAARPDARAQRVNPDAGPKPAAQPADPYRPTTLLDTFLRIRDGHSVVPGSRTPAWSCDLDHVDEYSFIDPPSGGHTRPEDMNSKDRLFHNLKTHGEWLDDQDVDADGRAHPVFYTPEGDEIRAHPGLGIDLFPGLTTIRFLPPDQPPGTCDPGLPGPPNNEEPKRKRTRTDYKHQRRRAERARNKRQREQRDAQDGDPPF